MVVTQPIIDRAVPAAALAETAKQFSSRIDIIPQVDAAVQHALSAASPSDVICVAGSLYVVGEAKTALRQLGIE